MLQFILTRQDSFIFSYSTQFNTTFLLVVYFRCVKVALISTPAGNYDKEFVIPDIFHVFEEHYKLGSLRQQ